MPQLYEAIKQQCQNQCELLIVSKRRSIAQIQTYYDRGARDFGENRAQELLEKAPQLPQDIRWNFIGHLQRNKVRAVLPYLYRVCSLDSLELASVLDKEAEGILVMGPHVEDEAAIAAVFHEARALFDQLKAQFGDSRFTICSMGMSHDYPIALREGSTQLRLGTILFED